MKESNEITIVDKMHWWSKNGSFNLYHYLRVCEAKLNKSTYHDKRDK